MLIRSWQPITVLSLGGAALMMLSGCAYFRGPEPAPVFSDRGGVLPAPYVNPGTTSVETMETGVEPIEEPGMVPMEPLPPIEEPAVEPIEPALEDEPLSATGEETDSSPLTYTVQKGDSLWKIARRYDVSFKELAAYNNMSTDEVLQVGTVLEIPPGGQAGGETDAGGGAAAGTERSQPARAAQGGSSIERKPIPPDNKYTVQSGDSLWSIARTFGVSMNTLRELNDLSSDTLQIGQTLVLREAGGGTMPATEQEMTTTGETGTATGTLEDAGETTTSAATGQMYPNSLQHTVSSGETLELIADMYETSVEAIRQANDNVDSTEDLEPNMELTIPY